MEIQYAFDTDFIYTSHSFLEDVLKELDTELAPHHLICNTEKTLCVHVRRENKGMEEDEDIGCTSR